MARLTSSLLLDPRYLPNWTRLTERAERLGFRVFETYRGDDEQLRVFNLAMSRARPGESAHQYGLAVDYVPYGEGKGWNWPKASDPIWRQLHDLAESYGLADLSEIGDMPHIQVPNWREVRSEAHRTRLRRWERTGSLK